MNQHSNLSLIYIFPIGLILAFFLDGSLSNTLSLFLYRSYSMVPDLSLLWIVLSIVFNHSVNLHLMIWAAVVGGAFDWYYVGIWGVLLFVLPLLVYVSRFLYQYLPADFFGALFLYLIDLIIMLGICYFANRFAEKISGVAVESGQTFLVDGLIPTLLINVIIFIALYFPIQRLYNDCQNRK